MAWKPSVISFLPAVLLAALIGCGTCGPSPRIGDAPSRDSSAKTAPKESAAATAAKDDLPGLKELDPADRKLAERQKLCPVSGGPLGAMGKPYRMTVKGRVIFLCCEDCKDDVEKDQEGILKKVDALLAKK